jgi:hypothetical protein
MEMVLLKQVSDGQWMQLSLQALLLQQPIFYLVQ